MTRACETAERPLAPRVSVGLNSLTSGAVSDGMLINLRLSSRSPHRTIPAALHRNAVEGARQRAVQDLAGLHVERAFVTWTFKSSVFFLEIDRAGQMNAFLSVSV